MNDLERYGLIAAKNPREIVLLRGKGCFWKRCRFCDYHLDKSPNLAANYLLNQSILAKVTGQYGVLEVINSGSLSELDAQTLTAIRDTCAAKNITTLHFESHLHYLPELAALRSFFQEANIRTKIKIGIETFDVDFRENILCKGLGRLTPAEIAQHFDECCLLFGLSGQTLDSMSKDITTGLKYFERICINLMVANSASLKPDAAVLAVFMQNLYDLYKDNPRVDLLVHNTDFGVGGEAHE